MSRLEDPETLRLFQSALSNWNVTGYVTWKEKAQEWVRDNLEALTPRGVARLMHEHVAAGGEIDRVRETRPEWNDRDYHYDFCIPVGERLIYIETLLIDDDPSDPTVQVVSIHDA